jgi:Cu+-exporting ATPase
MRKFIAIFSVLVMVACQSGNKPVQEQKQPETTVQVSEATVNIGGMHCANCVASVEKGIKELDGIQTVVVSLEDSTAKVSFDPAKVDLVKINAAVEGRGYSVKTAN